MMKNTFFKGGGWVGGGGAESTQFAIMWYWSNRKLKQ